MHLLCCSVMNHSFHAYLFLLLSLGTKPECINRQIWMKRLFPNSAQRYFFSCLLNIAGAQHLFPPTHSLTTPPHPSQASLKKFLDYIQTGTIEKMAKVLDKGLDPNFHDPDNGGEFSLGKWHFILWGNDNVNFMDVHFSFYPPAHVFRQRLRSLWPCSQAFQQKVSRCWFKAALIWIFETETVWRQCTKLSGLKITPGCW